MKLFRNKILTYPTWIRNEVDKLIFEGVSGGSIRKYLENYKDKIGNTPDIETINRYIEYKKSLQTIVPISELPINLETDKLPDLTVLTDKKAVLEKLVILSQERLDIAKLLQETKKDPRWESLIKSYIEEVRILIETLAKLSGELQEEQHVVVNVVQTELGKILKVVYDVCKEICPEKINEFKEKLKEKYLNSINNDSK